MKTYAEKKGEEKFDWHKALSEKDIDWDFLKKKAVSWVTCACGNQCSIIPRNDDDVPIDATLTRLGGEGGFYGAIKNKNAKLALDLLALIELRSKQLIDEIKSDLE